MKTLKIFEYKGVVAASSDIENGKFLNDIESPSNMGVVVHTDNVVITPTALDILKNNYDRAGGSFSHIMVTRHADESGGSVGLLGLHTHMITSPGESVVEYSRDCDLSILDDIEVEDFTLPEEFVQFVDGL